MGKIMKLLGKRWLSFICIILLLFIQAQCELTLPEYTSGIINIGIQQNGIENAVPEKVRADEFQKLTYFIGATGSEDDVAFVCEHYSESDGVYQLSEAGKNDSEINGRLNDILSMPEFILYIMTNVSADSAITEQLDGLNMTNADGSVNQEAMMEQLAELDDSIISQVAVSYVKSEYDALGISTEEMQTSYILRCGGIMLIYSFITMASMILVTLLASKVGAGLGRDLRSGIFHKVMIFSSADFDSFSTASIITRCTNDVMQVQMFIIMLLRMVIYAPIIGFGALGKVIQQETSMEWVILVAIGAMLLIIAVLFVVAIPKFQVLQKLIDKLNLITREILTGLPVIRAFSKEEHEKKRFDIANMDLTKVNLFVNRVMSIMMPSMMFVMNGISVLIIWVGAKNVDLGIMQVGDITAFISYTMQIIMAFLMLAMLSVIMPRAIISMKRIAELFNKEISVKEPEKPKIFNSTEKGVVEFKNVSFHYGNAEENVINNVSFKTSAGQTTAIIGSTGSGKSTLVNMIPRFFDATAGEILVDGVNIKDVSLHDLRDKIGYIPQKAMLFSGTIATNIAYSDENMSQENIELAAKIAQAEEFINNKDEKYDSDISQGGTNVSGGQKQRLSIARAIAKKPEIYIFDDSFSALDYKTDVNLRKALKTTTAESTVIIVAQRISTVLDADNIIVLDDGKIAGSGTHSELMKNCEVYRQIAVSQLSEAELNGKEGA